MLNTDVKKKINTARDILVGKIPDPKGQIDQITNALIYKFMDDQDRLAQTLPGGKASFFIKNLEKYAWHKLFDSKLSNQDRANLYIEGIEELSIAKHLPELFMDIFKDAFLPFRDANTISMFLNEINKFDYHHSENLGNAFEYLLSIMGSQGDAGQFRTPRNIIEFIVDTVNPKKEDTVLDPACGTAGFLVEAYKHIISESKLSPNEVQSLAKHINGVDIDPGMAKIARVNLYLHGFKTPLVTEDDTLTNEGLWGKKYDVILANPPFMTPKGGISPHDKFNVNSKRAEVLFTDYIIEHLKLKGRAGIIVPEGVVFQSGKAYKDIRKRLIEDNYLWAVVSLPSGVFQPYSGVKTSILFIDRDIASKTDEILFSDVKNTGISLGAKNTTIEENDLPLALGDFTHFINKRKMKLNVSFKVNKKDIINNDYVLSLLRYKQVKETDLNKKFIPLKEISTLFKGKSSSTKTKPGIFPLVLTAKDRKTSDHFDFDSEGVAIPLISALGHGKAEVKRVHKIKGKFALANLMVFVDPNKEIVDPDFLYYVLENSTAKKKLANLMSGAANVSMKTSDVEKFKIPTPSLEIQQQIVAELNGYSLIISGAKQIINNWKPTIDTDPEWEKVKLEEVVTLVRGVVYSKKDVVSSNGYQILRAMNISLGGDLVFEDIKHVSKQLKLKKQQSLQQDDIFICLASGSKDHIGKVAYVEKDTNYYFGGFMGAIRIKSEKVLSKYLYFSLRDSKFNDYLRNTITGANINNLNNRILGHFEISCPPLKIQEQIIEKIKTENELVESAKKLIKIYEQKTKEVVNNLWGE